MSVVETGRPEGALRDAGRPEGALQGTRRKREGGRGYLPYLVPGVLLFVAVIAVPLVMNIGISFTRWQGVGEPDWVGLEQYQKLFADETFWISFRNNAALILAMAVIPTFLGLLLATALFDVVSKRNPRTTTALRAAFYLPQVLPAVVAGVVWGWILHPEYGSANELLRFLGLDSWTQNWLGDEKTALLSVMFVLVWIQIGYPLVIFMAGLQRVDPQLYEAAALDGANWWQRLWSVTVPQIRQEIFVVLLTCTIAALKSFDKIFVLTRGGPGGSTNHPRLLLVPELLREGERRLRRRDRDGPDGDHRRARVRVPQAAEPGGAMSGARGANHRYARTLVVGVLAVLGVLTLFPFLLVLLNAFKSPQDYNTGGPLSLPDSLYFKGIVDFWVRVDFGTKLFNSTVIAGSVAVLAVLVSVLTAYALGIGRVRGRMWIVAIFLLANLMPQEALVYPLYFLAKEVDLYDTKLAVIIIFTAIQAAFGTYLLSSVLSTFPREIVEAARIDGANRWQVLWRVVVPISWPTLSVLLVFFFIWTWNEFFLPMIMLISNDNQTVPVALGVLQGQRLMDATAQSASALLGIIPAVVFFLIFQRTLTRGIAVGAVK